MKRLVVAVIFTILLSVHAWAVEPFAIVHANAPTSDTTLDFTGPSGFGEPKAVIFIGTNVTSSTGFGTAVDHAGFGFGACDGTRGWAVWVGSDDNTAAASNGKRGNDDGSCSFLQQPTTSN